MVLCLLSGGVIAQQAPGLPFSNYYPAESYRGGMQNWAITQNSEGLLYVANNFGLLEFDGTDWRRYALPSGTKIRDSRIDSKGRILVAGQGDFGYFSPDSQGRLSFVSLADSLSAADRNFDEAWRIFITEDEIVFCTFQKLFLYKNNGRHFRTIIPEYIPESFSSQNGRLYISEGGYGLATLTEAGIELIPGGEFFSEKVVTGVISLSRERYWISTKDAGIYTSDEVGGFRPLNELNAQLTGSGSINQVLRLSNGRIAIGTQSEGIYIVDEHGNIMQHLSKGRGLNNRTVLCLFEDKSRNLWVGHNNGLSLVELSLPFTLINEQAGLPGSGYDAAMKSGEYYLGTNNGLYVKDMKEPLRAPFKLIPETEDQVYFVGQVGGQLVTGHQNGTYVIRQEGAQKISDEPGAWTFLSLRDHPGYFLGGNYAGLTLFKSSSTGLLFVRKIKGFAESSRVMEQDDNGTIWMAHGYKGVYRLTINGSLDSVSVKHYGMEDGLPSNIQINVYRLANRIVFSTQDGMYQFNASTHLFSRDPLFSRYFGEKEGIISMAEDPLGNIYFISTREMGVLNKQINGDYQKNTEVFGRIRPLLNDDLQKICILEANLVLYAAKEGFVMYDNLEDSPVVRQPFPTLIRNVRLIGPSDSILTDGMYSTAAGMVYNQPSQKIPVLSHRMNSLHISYSAPFLATQEGNDYRFRLEGYEDSFGEWTPRTEKEYTNLPAGNYVFMVQARNLYHQLSEVNEYAFIITPPWYRTSTAYLIYFILAGGLVVLFVFVVERKYQRRTKMITSHQEKELSKKETALRSREEEIDRLRNEKLTSEINIKNKELASTTMLLIHKNSFINTVKNNLQVMARKNPDKHLKKEVDRLMHEIEQNLSEDDGWEQFEIHFDRVHGDFATRFKRNFGNLSPQEIKLSAYLRMNLSTKEIAHLMNISVRGVEVARYRLRKKLDLNRSMNLQEFILKY